MTKKLINVSSDSEEVKSRYWAFLIYPDEEATPNYWKDFLIATGSKIAISPLHDQDRITESDYLMHKKHFDETNQSIGSIKKSHYHVIFCSNGPTTFNKVFKRVCKPINATVPFSLMSVPGYFDYLTHKGHEDKYQYQDSPLTFNGFRKSDFIDMSSKETFEITKFIINLCIINGITELGTLYNLLLSQNMNDELVVLKNNWHFINSYLCSIRSRKMNVNETYEYRLQDFETGEIRTIQLSEKQLALNLMDNI